MTTSNQRCVRATMFLDLVGPLFSDISLVVSLGVDNNESYCLFDSKVMRDIYSPFQRKNEVDIQRHSGLFLGVYYGLFTFE